MKDYDPIEKIVKTIDEKHREAVERNSHRQTGLEALLKTWLECENPDYAYISRLKAKLTVARQRFEAMKP